MLNMESTLVTPTTSPRTPSVSKEIPTRHQAHQTDLHTQKLRQCSCQLIFGWLLLFTVLRTFRRGSFCNSGPDYGVHVCEGLQQYNSIAAQ